uniref:hypothetical protein n=1 Tax=Pedobacter schmidteae TaxID=2201271 RepID=UPI000EB4D7F9|nr:hypothetical protein [Pedobacter schmidteae]
MKKMMKIKAGLSFLLTVVGLQNCKAPNDATLPQELNQYALLDAKFASDKYELVLLAECENYGIPHPIRLFYSVKDQVLLEVSRDEHSSKEGYHYYKLDGNANIIDSLYVPLAGGERTVFIGDYTVHVTNKGYSDYTTWPLNGDKRPEKIEVLNEGLTWDAQKTSQQSNEITTEAKYYFYDILYQEDSQNVDWCIKRLFFCRNEKWQVLYKKERKTSFMSIDERESYYRYRENFFLSSNDQKPDAVENFSLKYFEKQQEIKYRHSIGGGSQSFSQKGWEGTGYFDVPLLGDTLKIKQQGLIVEQGKSGDSKTRYYLSNGKGASVSPFNLNIFSSPRLNYALYSTSAYHVYAVRKKLLR